VVGPEINITRAQHVLPPILFFSSPPPPLFFPRDSLGPLCARPVIGPAATPHPPRPRRHRHPHRPTNHTITRHTFHLSPFARLLKETPPTEPKASSLFVHKSSTVFYATALPPTRPNHPPPTHQPARARSHHLTLTVNGHSHSRDPHTEGERARARERERAAPRPTRARAPPPPQPPNCSALAACDRPHPRYTLLGRSQG
jgi:hypothetical protein